MKKKHEWYSKIKSNGMKIQIRIIDTYHLGRLRAYFNSFVTAKGGGGGGAPTPFIPISREYLNAKAQGGEIPIPHLSLLHQLNRRRWNRPR